MGYFTLSHTATSFLVSEVKVYAISSGSGDGYAGIDAVRLDGAP
jgi:hypothetical protein